VSGRASASSGGILLVEDDEIQQLNVRRALDRAGIKRPLDIASDGSEALELLRSGQPSLRCLVLLDIHMPRMDGLEFLRQVRADVALKGLMVVVLTTSGEDRDKREAVSLNVAGYLIKSMNFPAFVEQLRTLDRYWSMMAVP